MAIFSKSVADNYTKVNDGACQIQCNSKDAVRLGIIHSDDAPDDNATPEFNHELKDIFVTLGTKDCYVKVFSGKVEDFSVTPI